MEPRIDVGLNDYLRVIFVKPQFRPVALPGNTMKGELHEEFTGHLTAAQDDGQKMENGTPDYLMTLKDNQGRIIEVRRSNIKFAYQYVE